MDTRLSNAVTYPSPAPTRAESAPVRQAVPTDLNPPEAVAAQAGSEQTRWQRDKNAKGDPVPRHNESSFETDRETGDLVYKVLDAETRQTIAQYPYESLLKLRAYFQAHDELSHRG